MHLWEMEHPHKNETHPTDEAGSSRSMQGMKWTAFIYSLMIERVLANYQGLQISAFPE